jgi:hypothetical protein
MTISWNVLGVLTVGAGLVDVFLNVLAYDATGLPVERSYRIIWQAVRGFTRHLPGQTAGFFRALGAPLMVVWTISGWIALQILGFAFIYYPAAAQGSLSRRGLPPDFWTALYFSASAIGSLSFSDAEPAGLVLHFVAAAETLTGFAIFTLGITYVLGLYRVVQDEGAAWTSIQHRSDAEAGPLSLLAPYFHGAATDGLSRLWQEFHHDLVSYLEGMRRYPVVYYFHVRQQYRSLPYMFGFIGQSASAVRWGLPDGNRVAADPWLAGLLEGYQRSVREVGERFMTTPRVPPDPPAERDRFIADRSKGQSSIESVADFLELEHFMAKLANTRPSPDHAASYERYQQWWRLTASIRGFVQAAITDFGMEPAGTLGRIAGRCESPRRVRRLRFLRRRWSRGLP